MYHYFVYLLLFSEGMASLVSLIYWKKNINNEMKYFSLYLTFIFLSELFGHITQKLLLNNINQIYLEYVVIPLEFLFFFWLYSSQSNNKQQIRLNFFYTFAYLLLLIYGYLSKTQHTFLSISYMFGSLFLLLTVFNYLYNFIKSDDIINFKSNPLIYISIGLLLFYVGSFPFYGLKNYLWTNFKIIGNNYWYVATILNCIMYCMFTLSFLCNNKQKSI